MIDSDIDNDVDIDRKCQCQCLRQTWPANGVYCAIIFVSLRGMLHINGYKPTVLSAIRQCTRTYITIYVLRSSGVKQDNCFLDKIICFYSSLVLFSVIPLHEMGCHTVCSHQYPFCVSQSCWNSKKIVQNVVSAKSKDGCKNNKPP